MEILKSCIGTFGKVVVGLYDQKSGFAYASDGFLLKQATYSHRVPRSTLLFSKTGTVVSLSLPLDLTIENKMGTRKKVMLTLCWGPKITAAQSSVNDCHGISIALSMR